MKIRPPRLLLSIGPGPAEDAGLYVRLVIALTDHSAWIFALTAACLATAGGLAAHLSGDPILAALTVVGTVIACVRTWITREAGFEPRPTDVESALARERRWGLAAVAFAFTVGVLAFWTFAWPHAPIVRLLIISVAVGALGSVTMSAVRPRLVRNQQAMIHLPLGVGILMGGADLWPLWIASLPYVVLSDLLIRYIYRITIEAIRTDEALVEESARLESALDTMAQGLCMFGPDGRLKGFNHNYLKIWGFDPAVIRHGLRMDEVVRHGVVTGVVPPESEAAVLKDWTWRSRRSNDFTLRLPDGRTLALSYRPMADGGHVATVGDITERVAAEAKLDHMARHDALTGLPNRRELNEELTRQLARSDGVVAVHIVDLDGFKMVNDTLGHGTGDDLLVAVAAKLTVLASAAGAMLARLGGDEFAILQADADADGAADLGRAVCAAAAEAFEVDQQLVVVGASVGVALSPGDGRDASTLLRCADLALYRAKAEGRGQCRLFEPAMDARAQARRTLELDLRRAAAGGEFTLHYQPMFDRATRTVSAFEALLRWEHPTRGLLQPESFMELAESAGLIVPIGEWVFAQAMQDAAAWPDPIRLAVNVSPAQLRQPSAGAVITRALAASGFPPERLELEITETVMLEGTDATLTLLHSLRALGVRIALDDFGTGYSSLSYLRAFPFDRLKIDRSFVAELAERPDAAAIVRAVSDLAGSLGMATTAEGVEDEHQLALLDAHACTEVQGYLFSRAVPLAEASAMLKARRAA